MNVDNMNKLLAEAQRIDAVAMEEVVGGTVFKGKERSFAKWQVVIS